jgi:hypothetical protein
VWVHRQQSALPARNFGSFPDSFFVLFYSWSERGSEPQHNSRNMFNMYRRRFYNAKSSAMNGGSSEELGHDRFNYMNPNVNYDKWPRRLRPKKNSLKVELEAPESPHMPEADGSGRESSTFAEVRHCNGSLREHQRLLNLRSSRHKCSPRCRVKVHNRLILAYPPPPSSPHWISVYFNENKMRHFSLKPFSYYIVRIIP